MDMWINAKTQTRRPNHPFIQVAINPFLNISYFFELFFSFNRIIPKIWMRSALLFFVETN